MRSGGDDGVDAKKAKNQEKARKNAERAERERNAPIPLGQLCENNCGQPAKFRLRRHVKTPTGEKKVWFWCCSEHYKGCPAKAKAADQKFRATNLEIYGEEIPLRAQAVKDKRAKANTAKFGGASPMASVAVREKRAQTNRERYGNAGAMSSEVMERRESTVQERYGVANVFQAEEVQDRIRETLQTVYGVAHHMQRADYKILMSEKAKESDPQRRATMVARYGVEFAMQGEQGRAAYRATCLSRFGATHSRKNSAFFRTIKKGMFGFKPYTLPSGRVLHLQGYEGLVLTELLATYPESAFDFDTLPAVPYVDPQGRERVYHPDIFIPGENLIIEVKSWWTLKENYELNRAKQLACIAAGYRYQFHIKDPRHLKHTTVVEDVLPDVT